MGNSAIIQMGSPVSHAAHKNETTLQIFRPTLLIKVLLFEQTSPCHFCWGTAEVSSH